MKKVEFAKISDWLNYLCYGIKENGLSKDDIQEIMYLSCFCRDLEE